GPRHVGPGQHGLADLGALLGGQLHVAAALLLLGLARLLALLTLHRALVARRLLALGRALALLARRLAGGLVALPALLLGLLVLPFLFLLGLLVLAGLVLPTLGRPLLTRRGLAGGLLLSLLWGARHLLLLHLALPLLPARAALRRLSIASRAGGAALALRRRA